MPISTSTLISSAWMKYSAIVDANMALTGNDGIRQSISCKQHSSEENRPGTSFHPKLNSFRQLTAHLHAGLMMTKAPRESTS